MRKSLFLVLLLVLSTVVPQDGSSTNAKAAGWDPPRYTDVSAGIDHACGLTTDLTVYCWGKMWLVDWRDRSSAQELVPKGLENVKSIESGSHHACALSSNFELTCWGNNEDGQTFGGQTIRRVKQFSAEEYRTCYVTLSDELVCSGGVREGMIWLPESSKQGVDKVALFGTRGLCFLNNAGKIFCNTDDSLTGATGITDLKSGDHSLCAYRETEIIGCLGNNPDRAWLEKNLDLAFGPTHQCLVNLQGIPYCTAAGNYVGYPSVPEGVLLKKIAVGYDFTCGVTDQAALKCWGDDRVGQTRGPVYASIPTPPMSLEVKYKAGKASLDYSDREASLKDGNLRWVVKNLTDKKTVCVTEAQQLSCQVSGLKEGKQYTFSVQGENEVGKSPIVKSQPFYMCPTSPRMYLSSFQAVTYGSNVSVSGSIAGFCEALPKTVEYRSKLADGAWSKWMRANVTPKGKFGVQHRILGTTTFQARATASSGKTLSASAYANAKIKTQKPVKISWRESLTKQGFTQGGVVTISFTGDRVYSGTCSASIETAAAYNFALVYMGSERHEGSFKVRSGQGQVRIPMRWNGKSSVEVRCQSALFQEFVSSASITFKATF